MRLEELADRLEEFLSVPIVIRSSDYTLPVKLLRLVLQQLMHIVAFPFPQSLSTADWCFFREGYGNAPYL